MTSLLKKGALVAFGLLLAAIPSRGAEKLVFAHYMVCCPTAAQSATLDDFKNEIREAQARGIDGFALNCGGWAPKEPAYRDRSYLMYQAAAELGTGFKLFFSYDFNTLHGYDPMREMIEAFRDHPNQLRYQGKPVLSTFGGRATEFVDKEFTGDKAISFIPFYYVHPATETPTDDQIRELAAQNPTLAGFFNFGGGGSPDQIDRISRTMADTWHGMGKIFMAPVLPFYAGLKGNFRVFEYDGLEGMAKQWETAIQCADWVEMVTWNDWGESSYVAPFNDPDKTAFRNGAWGGNWGGNWGTMLSHTAYLDASRYYIAWFKTGKPPAIDKDRVFYFYRLSPASVPGYPGRGQVAADVLGFPAGAKTLKDRVFASAFLVAPAQLEISVGAQRQTFDLEAGVHHVSLPMDAGRPRFILRREGKVVFEKEGELEITNNPPAVFNYFSGSAEAAPVPKS